MSGDVHVPFCEGLEVKVLWSTHLTVLKGPAPWQYHYLYVILDIFSRYVVGWMIAERESATLAKKLIKTTLNKHDIAKDQLTLHADRGASMKSKKVAQLLADLGVIKTHSRPHTSDDNPYSEAQFKTLKYRPSFPVRFNSIEDAERHCQTFFRWYNFEHKHSGIAMLTPHTVHQGLAKQTLAVRHITMTEAYKQHPQRFKYRAPIISTVPDAVWINKPNPQPEDKHDTDQH
jgi:putative transposase